MEPCLDRRSGIYEIVNIATGSIYVGSAAQLKKRCGEHIRGLSRGKHHSKRLQSDWAKHGCQSFLFRPLLICEKRDLLFYEQRAMDSLLPSYNTVPIAGSQLGYRHTEETRAKLSAAAKRTRNFTGHRHSEETKAKISASRKGKGGGPRSAERLKKIGDAHRGRPKSEEQKRKISSSLMGHKQSPEQIEKRRKSMPIGHYQRSAIAKSKLSDADVVRIRTRLSSGEKQTAIAKDFNVTKGVISRLYLGRSYAWVSA